MLRPTSAETNTVSYNYDGNGFRNSVTDARGNTTNFCYDVSYGGTAITTSRGNLTRRIDPPPTGGANRPVTLFQYDSKDNLTQTVPPKGVNSGATVTCAADLSTLVNPTYATTLTYDGTQTKLLSVARNYTDPDSGAQTATTKFEYNDAANPGLMTRVIPPRGNTGGSLHYTYATRLVYFGTGTKFGLLDNVTDALANKSSYDYDLAGRRIKIVDPLGNAAGGVPADHSWLYAYDKEDRVLTTSAPAPSAGGGALVTSFQYDSVGNRLVVIDPRLQVTKYLYDERDSLNQVLESPSVWTDPLVTPSPLITTEYQYDHLGNLSRLLRAKADASYERATDYAYDGLNRVRRGTQYPSWPATTPTLITQYSYDPNGNRATLLDPLNQTTTMAYDALNRLTAMSYSDGVTPNAGYTYDANGNRLSLADGTGSTAYVYDELNRLTSLTDPASKVLGYRYDLDGNRTKVIYPSGTGTVTYSFDNASRLQSLLDWASRTTSYQYFEDGSLKQATNSNTTTAAYSYDNARRLTRVANKLGTTIIRQHMYKLDAAGNRTQIDEQLAGLGVPNTGSTKAWGRNNYNQLGATSSNTCNSLPCSLSPLEVTSLGGALALAAGAEHSLAVKGDGTVWAWDRNDAGQLGDGTTTDRTAPIQVPGLSNVTAVSAGYKHSVALKSDGTIWTWGLNDKGQLGIGTTVEQHAPTLVTGISGVTRIAAGYKHNIVSKQDGTAWGWGWNLSGHVGDGSDGEVNNRLSPVQVLNLTNVVRVAAGEAHSLGLKGDGTLWSWGRNDSGQLGTGNLNYYSTPHQVKKVGPGNQFLTGVTEIAAGEVHSLGLTASGSVYAWGDNDYGQLGDGDTYNRRNKADLVVGLTGPVTLYAGEYHSMAVKNGTLWIWGRNDDGHLGDGTSTNRLLPTALTTPTGVTIVGGGQWNRHTLASTGSGSGPATETTTYSYDRLSRLTGVDAPGTPFDTSYLYDPAGNRSTMTRGSATNYSYDRADRITAAGAVSYTVNANGNLVAKGADSFAFDQANRMNSATVAGATSSYAYNGDGVRHSKTVAAVTTTLVNDVNRGLPVVLDDGTRKYVYGLGLAYAVEGSSVLTYHTDGLGSVRAVTDAVGAVTNTYKTDEFGVPVETQGPSAQPYRYTGEPRDAESGLVYLRALMYDPGTGRFRGRAPDVIIIPQTPARTSPLKSQC
ncbi:MAG: hypothetical protein EXR51_05900 [Dehalococcoidia bacterium]|nr:hypothetical protein [Dehalococcoidia bacterium]